MTSTLTHIIAQASTAAVLSTGNHQFIVHQAETTIGAGSSSVLPVAPSTANLLSIAAPTAEEYQDVVYEAETTIEIDDDEGLPSEDDTFSLTESVSPNVRDYVFENGRRYNSFRRGTYNMPNDDAEQEREDMKHHMVVAVCGDALHLAPLNNPQQILDVGTGTGIWCMEMGDQYPSAIIEGIDLSPIQPDHVSIVLALSFSFAEAVLYVAARYCAFSTCFELVFCVPCGSADVDMEKVPPNVKFLVDDVESEWLYNDNFFDYIHLRQMSVAIKNLDGLLKHAYRCLKPGGWIEFQDVEASAYCDDNTMAEDYPVRHFLNFAREGFNNLGYSMLSPEANVEAIKRNGFINVECRKLKVPLGTWPKNRTLKTIGQYGRYSLYDGLDSISNKTFTNGLGWSMQEVHAYLPTVRAALLTNTTHAYMRLAVIIAQKPLE